MVVCAPYQSKDTKILNYLPSREFSGMSPDLLLVTTPSLVPVSAVIFLGNPLAQSFYTERHSKKHCRSAIIGHLEAEI
jgi:hypothetical protein